jgi:XRN 5'-3' exonuclease N-terminus
MKGARLSRLVCVVITCLLESIDVEGFHQRLMRQAPSVPTWGLTGGPKLQGRTDSSGISSYSCTALYGIPKMFRWLTDLYPDILNKELEVGLAAELDVDNFYLDMNGAFLGDFMNLLVSYRGCQPAFGLCSSHLLSHGVLLIGF